MIKNTKANTIIHLFYANNINATDEKNNKISSQAKKATEAVLSKINNNKTHLILWTNLDDDNNQIREKIANISQNDNISIKNPSEYIPKECINPANQKDVATINILNKGEGLFLEESAGLFLDLDSAIAICEENKGKNIKWENLSSYVSEENKTIGYHNGQGYTYGFVLSKKNSEILNKGIETFKQNLSKFNQPFGITNEELITAMDLLNNPKYREIILTNPAIAYETWEKIENQNIDFESISDKKKFMLMQKIHSKEI
jgi:hypothetical protein